MSGPTDEELLAVVGRTLRVAELPPSRVVRDAREAFAWRAVANGLALLEYDSLLDDDGLARVRAPSGDRRLAFVGDLGRLDLSLVDGGRRLVGRVGPAAAGQVRMHRPAETRTTEADAQGSFIFEAVEGGPISIAWWPGDESEGFQTEWVTI